MWGGCHGNQADLTCFYLVGDERDGVVVVEEGGSLMMTWVCNPSCRVIGFSGGEGAGLDHQGGCVFVNRSESGLASLPDVTPPA